MKHSTLLAALLLTLASTAVATERKAITERLDRTQLHRRTSLVRQAAQERAESEAAAPLHKAARKATANQRKITRRQPAGTLYANLVASYNGIAYSWFGGFYDSSSDAAVAQIVEGNDGNVYIQGLCPDLTLTTEYWVKAEPEDGGFVVKRQAIGEEDGYYGRDVYYVTRLVYDAEEGEFYEDSENTDIHFTFANGVLRTTDEYAEGDVAYGIVYQDEDDNNWYWYGNAYWNYSTAIQTDSYALVPDDAVVEKRVLKSKNAGETSSQIVNVVIDGNTIYFQPYTSVPGWIVGTISGNQITVPSGQYLGVDEYYNNHAYFHVSHTELALDDSDEDYAYWYDDFKEMLDADVLTYNVETGDIQGQNAWTIDGAKDYVYFAALYNEPYIYIFNEVPALPADPDVTYFLNYDEEYGYGLVDFNVPTEDVDGNYITPDKLSYVVYIDDTSEAFEFDPDDYELLSEALTEIPFDFTDGDDFGEYYGDKEIALYFAVAKYIGVQSIYRGGGETHYSNIVVLDIDTEETRTIAVDDPLSAVRSTTVRTVAAESLTDVAGRQVGSNARGLLIKTITFADGSQRSYKLIRK